LMIRFAEETLGECVSRVSPCGCAKKSDELRILDGKIGVFR